MILAFGDRKPVVDPSAVVFEGATVVGAVHLGARVSVWFGAIVRADVDDVFIGARSNVQDRCVIHVTTKRFSTRLGDDVTVGHSVTLHGCEIGADCLIGMGATVLNGAKIGAGSLVGAGALVTERKAFPERSLIIGSPAKAVRTLSEDDIEKIRQSALHYVTNWRRMAQGLKRTDL